MYCPDALMLSMNMWLFPQTGRCKGFGFVEFACDEVAKIAAETMNNYLMFNKLLKCEWILYTVTCNW